MQGECKTKRTKDVFLWFANPLADFTKRGWRRAGIKQREKGNFPLWFAKTLEF